MTVCAGLLSFIHPRYTTLEKVFKNVWANNADALSVLYSGTGALKTDFTRTGKRTTAGMLQVCGYVSGLPSALAVALEVVCLSVGNP